MSDVPQDDTTGDETVRIRITPRSDYYDADDDRIHDELFELQSDLARELPDEIDRRPADGKKGIVTDVLIPLGSSGALTAMVEAFKAWIAKRPEHRTLDVQFDIDHSRPDRRSGSLHVDAKNVDSEVFDTIAEEVLRPGK